jgi:hypothetical protein
MSDLFIHLELERYDYEHSKRASCGCIFSLAVVFLLSVMVQVFLAGAGIFASASWLSSHGILGHVLPLIPLLMVILGLVGKRFAACLGVHTTLVHLPFT